MLQLAFCIADFLKHILAILKQTKVTASSPIESQADAEEQKEEEEGAEGAHANSQENPSDFAVRYRNGCRSPASVATLKQYRVVGEA